MKETDEKIGELQSIEQNLQQYNLQKQQFQAQLIEIESALSELSGSTQSYKIVGNIMVNAPREALEKELTGKKEIVELRIRSLEKQEERLKGKAKTIRTEVLGTMKDGAE
jgi:prefoldin beta subunit